MLKALQSRQTGTRRQKANVVRLTSANLTLSRSVAFHLVPIRSGLHVN